MHFCMSRAGGSSDPESEIWCDMSIGSRPPIHIAESSVIVIVSNKRASYHWFESRH